MSHILDCTHGFFPRSAFEAAVSIYTSSLSTQMSWPFVSGHVSSDNRKAVIKESVSFIKSRPLIPGFGANNKQLMCISVEHFIRKLSSFYFCFKTAPLSSCLKSGKGLKRIKLDVCDGNESRERVFSSKIWIIPKRLRSLQLKMRWLYFHISVHQSNGISPVFHSQVPT